MILERFVTPGGSVVFTDGSFVLAGIHAETAECYLHGCVIYFPTMTDVANVEGWPHDWRWDSTPPIMERICPHGVGHPDFDQANYNERIGRPQDNVHGCDGCCA